MAFLDVDPRRRSWGSRRFNGVYKETLTRLKRWLDVVSASRDRDLDFWLCWSNDRFSVCRRSDRAMTH
jgi:hypothetical protein